MRNTKERFGWSDWLDARGVNNASVTNAMIMTMKDENPEWRKAKLWCALGSISTDEPKRRVSRHDET